MSDGRDLRTRLGLALQAGTRGLALATREEDRALELLERVAGDLGWELHTWSAATGIDGASAEPHGEAVPLDALLTRLRARDDEGLWVLLDALHPGTDATVRRALREHAQRDIGPAIVLVGEIVDREHRIPELLRLSLDVAGREELSAHVRWLGEVLSEGGLTGAATVLDAHAERLAGLLVGLERRTVERLIGAAVLSVGVDGPAIVQWIDEHKAEAIATDGFLERVEAIPLDEVGGLDDLKVWLRRRALALDPKARAAAIPPPRGCLLVGVQGCGKSHAARATASALGLPLYRLDPGRLFGGTVGESEENLRRVLDMVDRMAPIVLWLDEVDKSLAGADGAASDAGTSARVLGSLLTWLQERTRAVFVVATANRIDHLPPELLRRGRLDETFFVDLPDAAAREAIAEVHLVIRPQRLLGTLPPLADDPLAFCEAAGAAEGFSGAELEAALVEARLTAFSERRPLSAGDYRKAIAATVPLSRSRIEEVDALRAWAHERARRA